MKKIYVVTVTTGKRHPSIFKKSLRSLRNAISHAKNMVWFSACDVSIKHIIYLNCDNQEDFQKTFGIISLESPNSIILFDDSRKNIGIAAALNRCNEFISKNGSCDLVLKMDDDVFIYNEENFFELALEIHDQYPNMVFSPYPVGLINNPGGPPAVSRFVYNSATMFPLTFRRVRHVGGMCRFSPFKIFESFKFNNDLIPGVSGDEDGQLSTYCLHNSIEMCYLENGLVAEHAYSTLGQVVIDREYFSDRQFESSVDIEVHIPKIRTRIYDGNDW